MDNMSNTPTPRGRQHVPSWSLADRLRKVRRDEGMTQEEMAHALGVKPVTLGSWESGRNRPDDVVGLASRIESLYGVPAAWLLGVLTYGRRATDTEEDHPRLGMTA